jgi:hypothetical protein
MVARQIEMSKEGLGDLFAIFQTEGEVAGETAFGHAMRGAPTAAAPFSPVGVLEGIARVPESAGRGVAQLGIDALRSGAGGAIEAAQQRWQETPEGFAGQKGALEALAAPSSHVGFGELRKAGEVVGRALPGAKRVVSTAGRAVEMREDSGGEKGGARADGRGSSDKDVHSTGQRFQKDRPGATDPNALSGWLLLDFKCDEAFSYATYRRGIPTKELTSGD